MIMFRNIFAIFLQQSTDSIISNKFFKHIFSLSIKFKDFFTPNYSRFTIKFIIIAYINTNKINKFLDHSQYSRCVFKCDNDVVDHKVVNIEFEDKSTIVQEQIIQVISERGIYI